MEMQQPHKSDATAAWRSAGPSKWQRAQEIRRGTMSSCTRRVWETRHPGVLGECLRERKHSGLHALCCIACKWAKTRILACCPSTRAPLSNERKHLVQSHNRLCQLATNGTKNLARVLDNSLPNIQS
jgi:hypothetical protein